MTAKLADNDAAAALLEMLPLTIDMRDHLRQEKTGYLPSDLPELSRQREFKVPHRVELDHILRQHWNPTLWKSPVFSSSERPVFIYKSGDLQKILYRRVLEPTFFAPARSKQIGELFQIRYSGDQPLLCQDRQILVNALGRVFEARANFAQR